MEKLNALAKDGRINENANVKDQHSIIINSPIDQVWSILTDLEKWSEWNPNIKNVVVEKVEESGNFKWQLDGTKISSQIQSMQAPTQLAWTGKSKWVKSIYVWQLEDDENQTIASLSASFQGGAFTILVSNHQKIYNDLMGWLASLKQKAEG